MSINSSTCLENLSIERARFYLIISMNVPTSLFLAVVPLGNPKGWGVELRNAAVVSLALPCELGTGLSTTVWGLKWPGPFRSLLPYNISKRPRKLSRCERLTADHSEERTTPRR
jgi:hypothetical protein